MLKRKTPLKRSAIKPKRKVDKRSADEKAYYAWLTTQPCVYTGRPAEQRHHLRLQALGAGASLRVSDWFAVPVTAASHELAHNTPRASSWALLPHVWTLWNLYGLDRVPENVRALAPVVLKESLES